MTAITVDALPPSVNHYVKHTRMGRHYKTPEAEAFAQRLALASGEHRGKNIEAVSVAIILFLGKGQRLDIDNAPKVVLDSLVRCGVIRSDASIMTLIVTKYRADKSSVRIEIN